MVLTENSAKVLNYLKGLNGANVLAADVAVALDLTVKQVNAIFTSAIQKRGLGFRDEKEIALEDGTHKKVKFLKLTEAGIAFDTNAEA